MSNGKDSAKRPDAQSLPDAIQWHEGMLLSPQHFQQADLRTENLLHYQLRLAAPYHWGVCRLVVDTAALVAGTYRLQELEAILPDGLVVRHSSADAKPLELSLEQWQERMKSAPVTVYLVAASRELGGVSVGGDLARYESHEGLPVNDENTGEGEIRIPRLRPRLRLMAGEAPPAKYVSFPLARVGYSNETYAVTPYYPPALQVAVDSRLGQACAELSTRLRETAAFLSERYSTSGSIGASGRTIAAESEHQIRALVAGLPAFEAVLYSGLAHPFALYLALCGLVGQVSAISGSTLPPLLPPYDHNDAKASFDRAIGFVYAMVEQVQLNYAVLPFRYSNGVFSLQVEPGMYADKLIVGVRPTPGTRESDALDWIDGALIGSAVNAQSMRERRVLGPARKRIDRDEDLDLVPPRGIMLFEIEADPEFIQSRGVLTIFNTRTTAEAARPTEIVLYTGKQDGASHDGRGGR